MSISDTLLEMNCGSDFSYLLRDGGFSPYKYKLLRGQSRLFVPCLKMLYNGEVQLYYSCGRMKSFASICADMDGKGFLMTVRNLLSAMLDLTANGLVEYQDTDLSPDKIFVDPVDFSVRLVYLPLSTAAFPGNSNPESCLRANLLSLMEQLPADVYAELSMLHYTLSDSALSFREVLAKTEVVYGSVFGVSDFRSMKLISTNAPFPVELIISKTPYVIGRSTGADGVLGFSRSISRLHCEISLRDGCYHVSDLGSKGGTGLNGRSLAPQEPQPIHNGDELDISGYVFRAVIE